METTYPPSIHLRRPYDTMENRKSLRIEHRKSKPLMLLKDYLLDDLSSCSSSGFMSFPRRPRRSSTSASIRLLLDIDLRTGIPSAAKTNKKKILNRASSSLFLTAAVKLVNAVKSPLWNTCFLPHCGRAARKLLPSEAKNVPALGMSRFGGENSVVSEKNDAAATGEGKVGVTDSRDCIGGEVTNPCSKEWIMGKEQFSPVSVLDYPFDEDDDAETDPHSKSSPTNLLPKRGGRRHEGLSRLAPVQLEERIASLEHEDEEAARLNESICLVGEESREDAQEKDETEALLERMLKNMKADIPSYDSKADVLILDFFREKMEEGGGNGYTALRGWDRFEDEAVGMAEEWARGVEARKTYLGWEMEGGRMAYLKDMERGKVRWNEMGNYGSHEDSEGYEVCLEVEDVVWTLLVYEVLIDIFG